MHSERRLGPIEHLRKHKKNTTECYRPSGSRYQEYREGFRNVNRQRQMGEKEIDVMPTSLLMVPHLQKLISMSIP
jgi:hypothetical protein